MGNVGSYVGVLPDDYRKPEAEEIPGRHNGLSHIAQVFNKWTGGTFGNYYFIYNDNDNDFWALIDRSLRGINLYT